MPQTSTNSKLISNLAMRNSAPLMPLFSSWEGSGQWNKQYPHHCRGCKTDGKNLSFGVKQTYEQIPTSPELTWGIFGNLNLNSLDFCFLI